MTPEQARAASYGPWEFHTEKWELAYIKRIDATIAALKSAGVPVIWVGLPSQRGPKASADSSYLNELYRSRAEKAGIVYVDIWDGFVDEAGRYSPQGPDYEGQIRRLRTGDGVYFTKFGARKLAHYVEREIQRTINNRGMSVALPVPVDVGPQAPSAKPGGPAAASLGRTGAAADGGSRRAGRADRHRAPGAGGRHHRHARADQGRADRRSQRARGRFQLAARQCHARAGDQRPQRDARFRRENRQAAPSRAPGGRMPRPLRRPKPSRHPAPSAAARAQSLRSAALVLWVRWWRRRLVPITPSTRLRERGPQRSNGVIEM